MILKNNQSTAVVISIEEYRRIQRRIKVLEMYFEKLQDMFFEKKAKDRANDESMPFKEFIEAEGFSLQELKEVMYEVEFK